MSWLSAPLGQLLAQTIDLALKTGGKRDPLDDRRQPLFPASRGPLLRANAGRTHREFPNPLNAFCGPPASI